MKNKILLCTIFFMYASVVGSESISADQNADSDIPTVSVSKVHGSTKNIELPDSETVRVSLCGIHGSTVNVYVHPSNKQIIFDGSGIHGSSIYSYGISNPQVTDNISNVHGSIVKTSVMHPARQYTYHALAAVAIVGLAGCFKR